ncbi:hypothetical protein [Actinoplanes sp. NPDC026623]|uniref:hypothetical protein n=1 Tax=Actinoplanes sp. NPDC026623 TaxID=3155610 RepID=UPI0033ED2FD6
MTTIARSLLCAALAGLAGLTIAGCDGHQPQAQPPPLTSIRPGTGPIEQWRYAAAQTTATLLAPQSSGATVLDPTSSPSVVTELSAALALGPRADTAAITQDVLAAYDHKAGLFTEDGAESLQVTWLATRWLTSRGTTMAIPAGIDLKRIAGALQTKVAELSRHLLAPEQDTASNYLLALRALEALDVHPAGFTRPNDVCAGFADMYASKDLLGVATWVELAHRLNASCDGVVNRADLSGFLAQALTDNKGAGGAFMRAVRENAVITSQRYLGLPTAGTSVCRSVLQARSDPFLPDINAATYRVCVDEFVTQKIPVDLSRESASRLTRDITWRGRLPATLNSNSFGVMTTLYLLRSLQFSDDAVGAVAQQKLLRDGSSTPTLDAGLVMIARGKGFTGLTDADQNDIAGASVSDQLWHDAMLGIVATQSVRCTERTIERLLASTRSTMSEKNPRDLLYRAIIVRALSKCGHAGETREASEDILTATARAAKPADAIQAWRMQDTRCLLAEAPDLNEAAVVALLPIPETDSWSSYSAFAGVRLTDILARGCNSGWWDGLP